MVCGLGGAKTRPSIPLALLGFVCARGVAACAARFPCAAALGDAAEERWRSPVDDAAAGVTDNQNSSRPNTPSKRREQRRRADPPHIAAALLMASAPLAPHVRARWASLGACARACHFARARVAALVAAGVAPRRCACVPRSLLAGSTLQLAPLSLPPPSARPHARMLQAMLPAVLAPPLRRV